MPAFKVYEIISLWIFLKTWH